MGFTPPHFRSAPASPSPMFVFKLPLGWRWNELVSLLRVRTTLSLLQNFLTSHNVSQHSTFTIQWSCALWIYLRQCHWDFPRGCRIEWAPLVATLPCAQFSFTDSSSLNDIRTLKPRILSEIAKFLPCQQWLPPWEGFWFNFLPNLTFDCITCRSQPPFGTTPLPSLGVDNMNWFHG